MYAAIVSPQEDLFMAVRPGQRRGMSLPRSLYGELLDASRAGELIPDWFVDGAQRQWGINLTGRSADEALIVRAPAVAPVTYSRATYEINLAATSRASTATWNFARSRASPCPTSSE